MAGTLDRKFTPDESARLVEWLAAQPDPAGDDAPPLSEFDRLLGILGQATAVLDDTSRKALASAWGAAYRLAFVLAEEAARRQVYRDLGTLEIHLRSAVMWVKERDPGDERWPFPMKWHDFDFDG